MLKMNRFIGKMLNVSVMTLAVVATVACGGRGVKKAGGASGEVRTFPQAETESSSSRRNHLPVSDIYASVLYLFPQNHESVLKKVGLFVGIDVTVFRGAAVEQAAAFPIKMHLNVRGTGMYAPDIIDVRIFFQNLPHCIQSLFTNISENLRISVSPVMIGA